MVDNQRHKFAADHFHYAPMTRVQIIALAAFALIVIILAAPNASTIGANTFDIVADQDAHSFNTIHAAD